MKRYAYEHLANGSFLPHVDRIFPFEQAAELSYIGIFRAISRSARSSLHFEYPKQRSFEVLPVPLLRRLCRFDDENALLAN